MSGRHDSVFEPISGLVNGEAVKIVSADLHNGLKSEHEVLAWEAEIIAAIDALHAFEGGEGWCRGEWVNLVPGEFVRAFELIIPPSQPNAVQEAALRRLFDYGPTTRVDFRVRTLG